MPHRRLVVAVVLVTGFSLGACSDDADDDPRTGAGGSSAETSDPAETAEDGEDGEDGGEVFSPEVMLDGTAGLAPYALHPPESDGGNARTVATIRAGGKGTLENRGYNQPAAAWTEDRVFLLDVADRLTAVDRTTKRVLWRVPRRAGRDDELCSLTVPSTTATTVVVNHGQSRCGEFTAYDQDSGRIVARYRSIPEEDRGTDADSPLYSGNEPLMTIGGRHYWVDDALQVHRVLDDGTSEVAGDLRPLLPTAVLGPDAPRTRGFSLLPGSDVFVLGIEKGDLRFSTWLQDREKGFLLGFRLTDDGVEKVWEHRVRDLSRRMPGHNRFSLRFLPEHRGLVSDSTGKRAAGTEQLRLWRLDPETGEPGPSPLTFPTAKRELRADGIPEILDEYGSEPVVTSRYYLGMISRYGDSADHWLGARDLETGRELWRWKYSFSTDAGGPEMTILGVDPEEAHVYVLTNLDFEQWVREIDLTTGQLTREWRIPDRPDPVRYDLDLSSGFLDGSNLLLVNSLGSRHGLTAGLFEL